MYNLYIIITLLIIAFGSYMLINKKVKEHLKTDEMSELKKLGDRYFSGGCGPGCKFQCKHGEVCPNMKIKEKGKSSPILKKNLPLGYGSTMGGSYSGNSSCSNNVNGVMKLQKENRYGKLYPEGNQMYGYCVEGSENIFDTPYFKTI